MPVVATSQTSIYNNTQDPNAGSSRLSTNPADPISRRLLSGIRFFLNSRRFLWDKPYNIKMQVKFVLSQDLQFFESELAFTGQGC